MGSENPVERYYDAGAQGEWERQDRHRTEFAVTWRALDDYLPRSPAAVLDVGGGPGRYSVELARSAPDQLLVRWNDYNQILETGQHQLGKTGTGFTDAYFTHPSEVKPLMEEAGLASLDLIACEGVVSMVQEQLNLLAGEVWERWVDLNYRLGRDPSVHGMAAHLLYVGRK